MNSDPRLILRDGRMTIFQMIVTFICVLLNIARRLRRAGDLVHRAAESRAKWNVGARHLGHSSFRRSRRGMGLGALFISPVADIIGRRAVVILSTLKMDWQISAVSRGRRR